ncbi:uncharacterized protein At4g22758-like [Telopea speciosissima]|uniref:uncharacterized protein At4g22758-like n=1 Tax=Telopea speciosissima TaxID=54955 RepID=UPI001CC6723C|nr:uncharacterized protein At4g22758-like [Telopea speciosissima]
MSDRSFRRRAPALHRKNSLQKPTPPHRQQTLTPRRSNKTPSKPVKILQRSNSELILYTLKLVLGNNHNETQIPRTDAQLFGRETCIDIFTTTPLFGSPTSSPSPRCSDIYSKDAKVVVTVTVEGSPGPVKMMVMLGWSVEEIIRDVLDKYREERRTPPLDSDSVSSFHLYHSWFSLHNLDKKQTIGEIGSRSFYLRKSNVRLVSDESSFNSDGLRTQMAFSSPPPVKSEVVSMRAATVTSMIVYPPSIFSLGFIAPCMHKLLRRMLRLCKLLSCMQ